MQTIITRKISGNQIKKLFNENSEIRFYKQTKRTNEKDRDEENIRSREITIRHTAGKNPRTIFNNILLSSECEKK